MPIGAKTSDGNPFEIRPYRKDIDEAFVFNSWCNKIRKCGVFAEMNADEFSRHKREVLELIVCEFNTLVANAASDLEHVLGWACGELDEDGDQVLYFVYVKHLVRRFGVATALLQALFDDFKKKPIYLTHPTMQCRHLKETWGLRLDPYRIQGR